VYMIIRRYGRVDEAAPALSANDRSNRATITEHRHEAE